MRLGPGRQGDQREFPDEFDGLAAELREVLGQVPEPQAARMSAARSAFLTAGAEMGARPPRRAARPWLWLLRQAGAVVVLLLISLAGAQMASANSLPGDTFYVMKMGMEQIDALFEEPEQWEQKVEARRRAEVLELVGSGRAASVSFEGLLEQGADGIWRIGGVPLPLNGEQQQLAQQSCTGRPVKVQGVVMAGQFYLSHLIPTCLQVTPTSATLPR